MVYEFLLSKMPSITYTNMKYVYLENLNFTVFSWAMKRFIML